MEQTKLRHVKVSMADGKTIDIKDAKLINHAYAIVSDFVGQIAVGMVSKGSLYDYFHDVVLSLLQAKLGQINWNDRKDVVHEADRQRLHQAKRYINQLERWGPSGQGGEKA
jgi:hypothetical protein